MLLCIDNNHRVSNSSAYFVRRSALDGHVRNKIGNIAHLTLLVETRALNLRHSRICRIHATRVEVLKTLKRSRRIDLGSLSWNNENRVTIKVCARQTLCYLGVDTNRISCICSNGLSCALVLVVDREFGDLKYASVRIANKNHGLTIPERRSIDLVLLHVRERQNNLRCLSRQTCCFKIHS